MKKILFVLVLTVIIIAAVIGYSFLPANSSKETETQKETTTSNNQNKSNEEPQKNTETLTLFFANADNSAVPSETREVEIKEGNTVKAAIEALIKGPVSSDLRKTLPEGTKLLSSELKGDLVIVDFSKEYGMANDIAEVVERVSIVNTLTSLDGIKRVKILVEGKDLIGPSGEPFGELTRVALDEQGRPIPGEVKKITLYFDNGNADTLIAERRDVVINKGDSMEKIIIEELIKGPSTDSLYFTIPKETRLLSAQTKDGICTVDLSREFVEKHPGGSAGEIITLDSIVNSLTELEYIKKVQLLVEGEKREAFIHLEIGQPLERDERLIQK